MIIPTGAHLFCKGHNIWWCFKIPMFMCPPFPTNTASSLNFVNNKINIFIKGKLSEISVKVKCCRTVTTFSKNRFDNNSSYRSVLSPPCLYDVPYLFQNTFIFNLVLSFKLIQRVFCIRKIGQWEIQNRCISFDTTWCTSNRE